VIKIEQSAQPFGLDDSARCRSNPLVREGDDIIKSLVIAFVLMERKIFIERMARATLAEANQLIEAFILVWGAKNIP
jgi:hypothetical protein